MAGRSSSTAHLSLYTIVWGSTVWKQNGAKIPWTDPSPRRVAEASAHMIWSYVRTLEGEWWRVLLQSDKPSVIGHTALLAQMPGEPDLLLSSIGGDVGFYHIGHLKHHEHFPPPSPILVSCHLAESLAGHLDSGNWEEIQSWAVRMHERDPPRVAKTMLTGDRARQVYGQLADIKRQTEQHDSGPGAPRHFGLNTTSVRLVSDLWRPLPMRRYQIDGSAPAPSFWSRLAFWRSHASPAAMAVADGRAAGVSPAGHEIHGGCANAAASVLTAVGLGALVPPSARFEMQLNLADFRDSVLPMLIGPDAFDAQGRAIDEDLTSALDRLPKAWGKSDTLRFADPNYWIETIPDRPELVDEIVRIASRHLV